MRPPLAPAACSSGGTLPGGCAPPSGSRGLLIRRDPARGLCAPLWLPRLAHPAGPCQGAVRPPLAPAACSSGGTLPGGCAHAHKHLSLSHTHSHTHTHTQTHTNKQTNRETSTRSTVKLGIGLMCSQTWKNM